VTFLCIFCVSFDTQPVKRLESVFPPSFLKEINICIQQVCVKLLKKKKVIVKIYIVTNIKNVYCYKYKRFIF